MPELTTACPRNCYSTCAMRAVVEDGRLVALRPHAGNRATPDGPCLKGLSYVERVASPDRLLHPLARTRGGAFERISWDDALDRLAERLTALHADPGPQSVLYYAASGTKGLLNGCGLEFWRLWGGCTTIYGDLCWPAGLEATRLTLGANEHNAPWDLANARRIVFWGKNPAETNVHQMAFVEEALRAGARLTVIDPRRTETAERAHLLVQPRPGSDGVLAMATAHVLFRDGLVDRDFTVRHVLGAEEYGERVKAMSPEATEAVTGVAPRYVERLAREIGDGEPATICAGYGMQRYTNGGQTIRAILALLALTGNVGRPGAGWIFANLQTSVFGQRDPIASYPPERPDGVVRVSISTARLGRDLAAATDPPLRFAWIERGNPVAQNPESHRVLASLRALDFRVVVDQFLTDTAREADLVLPAKTMFEQTDVIGAYWHPYLQLRQKVLEPPGEVKPETEIWRALAARLGLPAADVDARIPADADVEAHLARKLAPFPEVTLDRLREGPVLSPGFREIPFADGAFPTPSGKIELLSEEAARRWGADRFPDGSLPVESALTGGSAGGDGRYPLQLLTPNTKNRIHSQFGNLAMIRAKEGPPRLDLSPGDAAARGIRSGDCVRVFNDRGSLVLAARVDLGLREGCVSTFNGTWLAEGGGPNVLSEGRETDLGHGAAFHDNLVEVERVT